LFVGFKFESLGLDKWFAER